VVKVEGKVLILAIVAATLLLGNVVAAQEEYGRVTVEPRGDSLAVPNESGLRFERNLNTYSWIGRMRLEQSLGLWGIRVRELFRSTIIKTDQKFIKDDQSLSLVLTRKLSERVALQFDAASLVLSDNRSIGINRASIHSGLVGAKFQLQGGGTLMPSIGVKSDNQTGQRDHGLSYRVTSQIGELDLSGYRTSFYGQFSEDRITPRKGESHVAALTVGKTFLEQTRDSLTVQFYRNRRDFYFPADSLVAISFGVTNNIEQRIENILDVTNQLNYGIGKNILLLFNTSLRQRGIAKNINYKNAATPLETLFDTEISEFKFDSYVQGQYQSDRTGISLRLAYGERDEDHEAKSFQGADRGQFDLRQRSERRKNNSMRRTALSGNLQHRFSRANVFTLSAFASLLRYDTPSSENTDDRDELLMIFGFFDQQSLGKNLTFSLSADAVLNHIVYLFSDRSANNNWNRVLRLSPRIVFRPSASLRTTNAFEVLANYTVYDFEEQVFSVRSYSFRQYSLLDSTTYELSRRVALDFSARVKLYEQGQLRWKEFRERPINYFEDRTFFGQFRYTPSTAVSVAVGFRYFSLTRFRYEERERVFENRLTNYGPTCLIQWSMDETTRVVVSGWYEVQDQTGGLAHSISNIALNIVLGL
jgi:hypothetical protein